MSNSPHEHLSPLAANPCSTIAQNPMKTRDDVTFPIECPSVYAKLPSACTKLIPVWGPAGIAAVFLKHLCKNRRVNCNESSVLEMGFRSPFWPLITIFRVPEEQDEHSP